MFWLNFVLLLKKMGFFQENLFPFPHWKITRFIQEKKEAKVKWILCWNFTMPIFETHLLYNTINHVDVIEFIILIFMMRILHTYTHNMYMNNCFLATFSFVIFRCCCCVARCCAHVVVVYRCDWIIANINKNVNILTQLQANTQKLLKCQNRTESDVYASTIL